MRTSDQNRRKKRRIRKETYNYDCNFCEILDGHLNEFCWNLSPNGKKTCIQSCRSRQKLSNEYFVAKFGVDTEENEPYKV